MPRPKSVCDYCLLRAVAHGEDPVTSTSEVVDLTDLSREGARQRLTQLADAGLVEQTIKGKTALWYLSLAGHQTSGERCACGNELLLGK